MDLRVIVLAGDMGFSAMLRAQVENLGCVCNTALDLDEALAALEWADAAVIDLAGDGLEQLERLRVAAPELRVLGIAPDAAQAKPAKELHAAVLIEPFAIPDLVQAVRGLERPAAGDSVIDLRDAPSPAAESDDAPWWATR